MDIFKIIFMVLIIILIFLIPIIEELIRKKSLKKKISLEYGKSINIKKNKTNIKNVRKLYDYIKNNKNFYIDDITWNDLDMDAVFLRINNTQTSIGDKFLYNMLRTPEFSKDELEKRNDLIEFFQFNSREREKISFELAKLGKLKNGDIYKCLLSEYKSGKNLVLTYKILRAITMISILLLIISKYFLLLIIPIIILNSKIYFNMQNKKGFKIDDYNYILNMVVIAKKIQSFNIKDVNKECNYAVNELRGLKGKNISKIDNSSGNELKILGDMVKIISLIDAISYEEVKELIRKYRIELINIYEFIGKIDSCIAVASYRTSLKYYDIPKFCKERKLKFIDEYNPLIENPIVNSCLIENNMLITGSNASGKSTFLRTVALNSILAQTIYTVHAKEYITSFFRIFSSMALKDDLINGESYYMVESKSLKRIIDEVDKGEPILCFVDEVLRGTNTIERISASSEILGYFYNKNAICIAATHDRELTYILENKFNNYHFEENMVEDDIKYDYKIYKGRANTTNAINILKLLGYKEDIYKNAKIKASKFQKNGEWVI